MVFSFLNAGFVHNNLWFEINQFIFQFCEKSWFSTQNNQKIFQVWTLTDFFFKNWKKFWWILEHFFQVKITSSPVTLFLVPKNKDPISAKIVCNNYVFSIWILYFINWIIATGTILRRKVFKRGKYLQTYGMLLNLTYYFKATLMERL